MAMARDERGRFGVVGMVAVAPFVFGFCSLGRGRCIFCAGVHRACRFARISRAV